MIPGIRWDVGNSVCLRTNRGVNIQAVVVRDNARTVVLGKLIWFHKTKHAHKLVGGVVE